MKMDFLSVCDSGDWGEGSDTKDLHAQLFSHSATSAVKKRLQGKKSKATKQKQRNIHEEQNGATQPATKYKKNLQSEKPRQDLVHKKSNDAQHHQSENADTHSQAANSEKTGKKKRIKETNDSRIPVKKRKMQSFTDDSNREGEPSVEVVRQPSDKTETSEMDESDMGMGKKKRKRKPRNNKFKTPEFGFPEQTDIGSKSLPQSQMETSIDPNLKLNTKANQKDRNAVNKKAKGRGKRNSQKLVNTKAQKLNKTTPVKEVAANERTKPNVSVSMKTTKTGKIEAQDSKHLNQATILSDRTRMDTHGSSCTTAKTTDSSDSAVVWGNDNGTPCGLEEPLPDTSARQTLKSKMEAQLKSAHFRYLNEQLYKTTGSQAQQMMSQDREAFEIYHSGFSQQVKQWPVNPVNKFIEYLETRPATLTVGDFGCGEARIAQSVGQTVHSFDLVALNEHVTVCDIAKVPLKNNSLDVAIFCLSLMGTNWTSYIKEANRVLKKDGQLKIAEVASRFTSATDFLKIMRQLGFQKDYSDFSNKMFLLMDFSKQGASKKVPVENGEVLRPCLYKKR